MTSWHFPSAAFLLLGLVAAPALAGTVVSVGDGDTLRVMEGSQRVTVRLACIDAPETAQQPYGAAARQRLQQLAPVGTELTLRVQATDRYGRTVAELFRGGQSINLQMVRDGQAFAYRQYLRQCDENAYLGAEASAQQQRLGVWSVPGGIERPWDWRHSRRSARPAGTSAPPAPLPVTSAPVHQPQPSGPRLTCRQIGSFAKAQELLKQGYTYLDRDGDGVACESLR